MFEKIEEGFTRSIETVTSNLSKALNDAISHMTQVIKDISPKISEACKVPPAHPSLVANTSSVTSAIDEYMDREKRKCNLILYNIPETTTSVESADGVKKDSETFKELVSSIMDKGISNLQIIKAIRLCKLTSAKPKPLLISIHDELCKREILRSAYKLSKTPKWSNIYVSPDYTRKERETNKVLREELKRCKENGEVNLGIRNGMIVVKQPRSGSS